MKRMLAALLALILALGGCTGREAPEAVSPAEETGSSSRVEEGASEPEQDAAFEEEAAVTAVHLTRALASCTRGFTTEDDPAANRLQPPSMEDSYQLGHFVMVVAAYAPEADGSRYADLFPMDEEYVTHLSCPAMARLLEEVLGVTEWDPAAFFRNGERYDPEEDAYLLTLAFDLGYGWAPEEIGDVQVDTAAGTVTVSFTEQYLFPGATGKPDPRTSWDCQAVYALSVDGEGRPVLRLTDFSVVG